MSLPRNRLFWAISLGHLSNDTFMSMGPVVLAFISTHLFSVSNTQIGLAISIQQLLGAISQPFFGYVADKRGGRLFGAGGVFWTISMLSLSLGLAIFTGDFWLMAIPYALAAFGSGAFHPVGATHAADSDKLRSASNLSIFFFMGQAGLAIGPAVAGVLLDATSTHTNAFVSSLGPAFADSLPESGSIAPLFILSLAALPSVLFMSRLIPSSHIHRQTRAAEQAQPKMTIARAPLAYKPFFLLGLMVALRSFAQPGIVPFIPILFQDKGWTAAEYGFITSLFWLGSGFAGMIFGQLADRFGRRIVIMTSLLFSAPAFFLLPVTNGALAFVLAVVAGALSGGSHSIIVVLAQEMIPTAKGFASGTILGFIFGTGALATFIIGLLADTIGVGAVFQVAAGLTVIAGLLALVIPTGTQQHRIRIDVPEPEVAPVIAAR